jgi:hypothetical protein
MTRSSSDWISLVLQNAYVGDRGDLRLQDFSDSRARIDWASKSEPHQVRVERFVLDPGLQKGRNSCWRTNNSSWVTSDVPAGLPKHWLPSLQGSAFLDEVEKHSGDSKWLPSIRVPVILGRHMLGSLTLEVRWETIQRLVDAKPASHSSISKDKALSHARSRVFDFLHPLASVCGYIELWAQGKRDVRNGIALQQALLSWESQRSEAGFGKPHAHFDWARSRVPDPDEVYIRCCHLQLVGERSNRVELVDLTPSLIQLLRENPQNMAQLSPMQFEHLVANRLDRMGFDVVLTGGVYTRDGGIDLVATPKQRSLSSFLLATQIKHHQTNQPTTRGDVDRLLAWKDSVFRMGLIVTNTRFTEDAKWIAAKNSNFIRLREFGDLTRWLQDNFRDAADWSELPRSIELAPGIVVQIPTPRLPDATSVNLFRMDDTEDRKYKQ